MKTPISQFFESLGLPLRNIRNSWGASNGTTILLRSWSDRYDAKTKQVVLLRPQHEYLDGQGPGRSEREEQLRRLWAGGMVGYVVLVNAKDTNARPREIVDFRRDIVWNIVELHGNADGSVVAILGDLVPVDEIARHAATHALGPTLGSPPF